MEGYVYLGEHYDVMGRDLNNLDKKIGLSRNPVVRENQLNRTKSPIGYRILSAFKVDDMGKVEKMLHSILDSRRLHGEWFRDEEDTLNGEFINFMGYYGGETFNMVEIKEEKTVDIRLVSLVNELGDGTILVRRYKGIDYDVKLDKHGLLHFNGEIFDTPNKLYNNGIVKLVNGKKGSSGTNGLSQFIVKKNTKRLVD